MTSEKEEQPSGARLDSWKEIAAYLKRDVATVRRWEKREALPVHRHIHDKLGSVYAYVAELDAWQERRRQVERVPRSRFWRRPAFAALIAAALVAAIAVAVVMSRRPGEPGAGRPPLRIAVHRAGTVASLVAVALQEVLSSLPGVTVDLVEQQGMLGTLRALDAGQIDIGLAFNLLAFHAVKTDRLLGHRSQAITALTVAYPTPAQIIVRADSPVKTVAGLRGKRVSLGTEDSGERFSSRILLSHLGLDVEEPADLKDFGPSLEGVLDGGLDAYITWRGMPAPDVDEAFAAGRLRLIALDGEPIESLRSKHPFLVGWTIPSRLYANQMAPVPTVTGRILLLASASLSAGLVNEVMRRIDARLPDLIARHPAAAEIELDTRPGLGDGLSIDLHPGAERFFEYRPSQSRQ